MASRGMSNIGTYRQGRTVHIGDKKGNACACGVVLILMSLVAIAIPMFMTYQEIYFYKLVDGFNEIKKDVVEIDVSQNPSRSYLEKPVHFISSDVKGSTHDDAFGVTLEDSLKLNRRTEYCQWIESHYDQCETCTRQVRAKDGSTSTESYSCNCVRQYSYIKSWRPFRVNSLLFNQPAAHYNPQRDPYPAASIYSSDVEVGAVGLDPNMVARIKSPAHRVEWTKDAQRGKYWYDFFYLPMAKRFGWVDRTRYQHTTDLAGTRMTEAFRNHKFVYAGNGYFFSPYVISMQERILKFAFGYLEGSLLDYQFGDFIPSCEAGDIRIHYDVVDPDTVSVLGRLTQDATRQRPVVTELVSRKDFVFGAFYGGQYSAQGLIDAEAWEAKLWVYGGRVLLFLWSLFLAHLLALFHGYTWPSNTIWCATGITITGLSVSAVWAYLLYSVHVSVESIWFDVVTISLLLGSTACLVIIYENMSTHGDKKMGGLNAVWCWVAALAGAPPEWRVVNTYRPEAYVRTD